MSPNESLMHPNDRALITLHAFEHGLEVPGGLACVEALRDARLDYSLASLARIDALLDALRAQQPPAEAVFVQSQGNANLLWLLGCYAGELLGRSAGVPARWDDEAPEAPFQERASCRFGPGVSARFQPLRTICARLFGNADSSVQAAFASYFALRFAAAGLPPPEVRLPPAPLPDWPADLAGSRPSLSEAEIARLRLQAPPWAPQAEQALAGLFAGHAALLRSGRVVWGGVIAPDNALPGPQYHGGLWLQLVYDPAGRIGAAALERIADRLYNEPLADPDAIHFIHAEHPRPGLPVPAEISPWPLWMTFSFVPQSQLPDGLLSLVSLPLLIDPAHPEVVAVLPAQAWPATLRERWSAAGEALHGQRQDPERLRQQRIVALRDPAMRQSLLQDFNYQFGAHHFHGAGGAPDYTRARECWESACRGEPNPHAMVALGILYAQGLGVPIDTARARRCFQAASELGFEPGDFELGRSYLLEGNVDMARLYLQRAANAGHAPAVELLRTTGAGPVVEAPPDAPGHRPRLLFSGLACAGLAALAHFSGIGSLGVVVGLGLLAVGLLHLHMRLRRDD